MSTKHISKIIASPYTAFRILRCIIEVELPLLGKVACGCLRLLKHANHNITANKYFGGKFYLVPIIEMAKRGKSAEYL